MGIDVMGRNSDTQTAGVSNDPYKDAGNVIVEGKTLNGKTLNKSKAWWYSYNSIYKTYPEWGKKENQATYELFINHAELNSFSLNEGQIHNFMMNFGLDPSNFKPAGSGSSGSGKSFAQRQNDIQSLLLRIQNQASILGIPKNNDAFLYIAKVAEKQSWSEEQLTKSVVDLADWKTLNQGTLLQSVDTFTQLGRNYFVNVDKKTARDWADKIASGSMSAESVEKLLQQQSKLANPWLADTIDQGISPSDLLSSSRAAIAKSLGIQVGEIDFTDSKWMNMVTSKDDKGVTSLADQNTIRLNVRKDERWAKSDEAKELTGNMGNMLAKIFGMSSY